jgi:hypothetical protein
VTKLLDGRWETRAYLETQYRHLEQLEIDRLEFELEQRKSRAKIQANIRRAKDEEGLQDESGWPISSVAAELHMLSTCAVSDEQGGDK